jgi:hypothetical protein
VNISLAAQHAHGHPAMATEIRRIGTRKMNLDVTALQTMPELAVAPDGLKPNTCCIGKTRQCLPMTCVFNTRIDPTNV